MLNRTLRLTVVGLLVVACGRREETAADTSGMKMDSSMPGMAAMHGDSTMDAMMAHMQAVIDTATPATIKTMMPEHRRMVDSMLTSMGDASRRMNMTHSAERTALADSVRQDMTTMTTMSDTELPAFVRAHHSRMIRLVQMHRSMMQRPPAK